MKGKLVEQRSAISSPSKYYTLIDRLDLDIETFSKFIHDFKNPNRAEKDQENSPYELINKYTGTKALFDEEGFFERTKYEKSTGQTSVVKGGLENEYGITVLRGAYKAKEDHVLTVERLYMIDYFMPRWSALKDKFGILRQKVHSFKNQNLEGKPLLPSKLKAQLETILGNPDEFLGKSFHVHLGASQVLTDELKPALQFAQVTQWKGEEKLREDLIELYVTYTGLFENVKFLHTKNTKIKQFHDEN